VITDLKTEELLYQAIERFWETIPPVWNTIKHNVRSTATDHFDISVEQFHILRHIRKGIVSVSDLATERQISRPAISQAVDVLVDKGLIARGENAEDRRFVQLELTPTGNDLLNTVFEKNRAWMKEQMASLTQEEMNTLLEGLAVLKKTFLEPNR
jgi:DNA-binding MarR family transcriptional regulator